MAMGWRKPRYRSAPQVIFAMGKEFIDAAADYRRADYTVEPITTPAQAALNIPAFDLFLQLLHQVGNALQTRINGKRAAIDFQSLLVIADILQDQP